MATRTWLAGIVAVLSSASMAKADYIPLPLIISPGSVNHTIVQNGDFETDSGHVNLLTPTGWGARLNNVFASSISSTSSPVEFPAAAALVSAVDSSTEIAYGDTNTGAGIYTTGGYSQTVSVSSGADYVLSADLWNFSGIAGIAPDNTAQVHAEIFDGATPLAVLTILPTDPGGGSGYFGYASFTATSGTLTVQIQYDNGAGPAGEDVVAVWDNVSVTPQADFVAPTPEPASLGLLVSGLMLISLRRRR